jgi:putative transposase
LLADGPLPLPQDWVEYVNAAQTDAEVEALRRAVKRGSPFGSPAWQKRMAMRLGLAHTLRPIGRPKRGQGDGHATASE